MKKTVLLLLALSLMLTLTACYETGYESISDIPDETLPAPQSKEELYSLYEKVDRDMTKADIEEMFGPGNPILDDYGDVKYFNYYNESKSAGVSVIYEDDIIKTKTLFFNSKSNLIPFSGRYINEKVPNIKSDMTVETACEIMGSVPLELACTYNDNGPLDTNKIYCWYNEDSSNFMLHTESGIIENVALYRD